MLAGAVFRTVYALLSSIESSQVLVVYFSIYFGFMYARAGVGAVLPTLLNSMLLFYAYLYMKTRFMPDLS